MSSRQVAGVCGLSLIVISTCAISSGLPILSPMPVVIVWPLMVLADHHLGAFGAVLALAIPSLSFWAWNPGLWRGEIKTPKRSFALLLVLTVFTAWYFKASWPDGVTYQGLRYTAAICAVNAVYLTVLWIIFIITRKKCSFKMNVLTHWMLFAWLGWCAFPYLGMWP